jgi:hypothetical protein
MVHHGFTQNITELSEYSSYHFRRFRSKIIKLNRNMMTFLLFIFTEILGLSLVNSCNFHKLYGLTTVFGAPVDLSIRPKQSSRLRRASG